VFSGALELSRAIAAIVADRRFVTRRRAHIVAWVVRSAGGVSVMGWRPKLVVVVLSTSLFTGQVGLLSQAEAAGHPATGVGSYTLKNWNPKLAPRDAKNLPQGQRPQSYKPDNYDCTGAKFAQQRQRVLAQPSHQRD
jgi:hypothetical protein